MFSSRIEQGWIAGVQRIAEAFDGLGEAIQSVADQTGGEELRRRHRYRNRTGNLEGSSGAYLTEDTPNAVTVRLEPLAEYAPFVANRGYLDTQRAGERAERAIDRVIAKLPG